MLTAYSGWACVQRGEPEAGIVQMREALNDHKAKNFRSSGPQMIGLFVEACFENERLDDAAAFIDEALRLAEETCESYWKPELYRLQGKLHLANAALDKAEAAFESSMQLARGQQAKFLVLRTAMSLACLWRDQDTLSEA